MKLKENIETLCDFSLSLSPLSPPMCYMYVAVRVGEREGEKGNAV